MPKEKKANTSKTTLQRLLGWGMAREAGGVVKDAPAARECRATGGTWRDGKCVRTKTK